MPIAWLPQGNSVGYIESDEFNSHLEPKRIAIRFMVI